MKALIRNDGETVTEETGIEGIDWSTGAPLTNEAWYGGKYKLVKNYVAPTDTEEASYDVEDNITVTEDTVTIDGVEYTKEELRELLGE